MECATHGRSVSTDALAGALSYGWEKVLEVYYDCKVWKNIHFAIDYRFVSNPAFNRDRGPVSVFASRLRMEL